MGNKPAAWLLAGRAELDAVGCVPFGGKLTGGLEVISRDILWARPSTRFRASRRPPLAKVQKQGEGEEY